jgi:DNA-binding LacI/PurR family transcriptional regulator
MQAMTEAGLKPVLCHSDDFDRKSTYELARQILDRPDRPSAIFATFDVAGISLLRAAADHGINVPKDLAVLAYDNIQEGLYTVPRLSTVAQPTDVLGKLATEHLIGLIEIKIERTFEMKLIEPRLVVRESCGATKNFKS